jgi:hypothetical protein
LHTPADHAERDFVGRRGLVGAAKNTAGKYGGQNERGPGGFQELPTAKVVCIFMFHRFKATLRLMVLWMSSIIRSCSGLESYFFMITRLRN